MAIEAVEEPCEEHADRSSSPSLTPQSGGKFASKVQNSHAAFSKQDSGALGRSRSAGPGSRPSSTGPSRSASVGPVSKRFSGGSSARQESSSKSSLGRHSPMKMIGCNRPKAANNVSSKSQPTATMTTQSSVRTSKSSSCEISPRQARQGRCGRGVVAKQGSSSLPSSPKNVESRDTKSPAAKERTPSFGPQGARSRSPSLPGHAELLWDNTAIELQAAEAKFRKRCDALETEGFQLRERLLQVEQAEEEGRSRSALLEERVAKLDRERAELSMQVAVMADRAEQERASKPNESPAVSGKLAAIALTSKEQGLMQLTQFENEREKLIAIADHAKMESSKREAEKYLIRAELAAALAAEAENEHVQSILRTELNVAQAKQERDLSEAKAQLAVAKAGIEEQIRRHQQIQSDIAATLADRDEQDRAQQRIHSDFAARMIHQLEEERVKHAVEVAQVKAQLVAAAAAAVDKKQKCESDVYVTKAAEKTACIAKVGTQTLGCFDDASGHVSVAAESQRRQSPYDLCRHVTLTSNTLKDDRNSPEKPSIAKAERINHTRNRASSSRKSAPAQCKPCGRSTASAPPEKSRLASRVAVTRPRIPPHKASCIDAVKNIPDERPRDENSLANLLYMQPSIHDGLKDASEQCDDRSTKASTCMYESLDNSAHASLENSDAEAEAEEHNVLVQRQYSAKITWGEESPTEHHDVTQVHVDASSEQISRDADYMAEDEADEFEAGLVELYNDGCLQLTEMCPCDSGRSFGECHFIILGLHKCVMKKGDNILCQSKPFIPASPSLNPLLYNNTVRESGGVACSSLGHVNILPKHLKAPEVRGVHPAGRVATVGTENVLNAASNRIAQTQKYPAQCNLNQVVGQHYLPPRVATPSACSTRPTQAIAKTTGANLVHQHIPALATPSAARRPDYTVCSMAPAFPILRQASIPTKPAAVPAMQAQHANDVAAATKEEISLQPASRVQERAQLRPRSHHAPFEKA